MDTPLSPNLRCLALVVASGALVGCGAIERLPRPDADAEAKAASSANAGAGLMDPRQVDALLSMTYLEAQRLSAQSMSMPPHFRVAADLIDHPPALENELVAFTATGKVFMEIDYLEPLVALAGKAEVSETGVVLSERPMLRRGYSIIESTSDDTIFRIRGEDLDIEGPHRVRVFGERPGEDADEGFDLDSVR